MLVYIATSGSMGVHVAQCADKWETPFPHHNLTPTPCDRCNVSNQEGLEETNVKLRSSLKATGRFFRERLLIAIGNAKLRSGSPPDTVRKPSLIVPLPSGVEPEEAWALKSRRPGCHP